MAFRTRVWGAGKLAALGVALLLTYLASAAATVRVALRAREVTAPDLAGRTVNDASATLADFGLTLRVEEGRRVDAKVPAGHILMQEPIAGATVRRQRSIKVWVSAGQRPSTAPRLVGESERASQLRLQQEGYTLGSVSEIRSSDYAPDSVAGQEPPPDAPADRVSLLVNRAEGAASYVMPDLIGFNGDRAADVMRAQGFRISIVGSQPYPGAPPGVVIRQSPSAGFRVSLEEVVSIEISR